jgi:adenosylmethionine-8-amino-7-oxononanoate aminotransferase
MVGIELVRDKKSKTPYPLREKTAWKVCAAARKKGLLIRPLGDVIVLMPPLNISKQALQRLVQITAESIREITEQ